MATVGIFDSGVGGLSVLKEIRKILPGVNVIYYGDNANCPYGPKGQEFIINRSRDITKFLISKGADVVVIACNTATSASASVLRKEFNIPIIGMVPAVKPAALCTKTMVIGVLATIGTLNADMYKNIKDTYGGGVKIIEHIGEGFVELVENFELNGEKTEAIIEKNIYDMVMAGADILVLGCSHYPFLQDSIEKVANRIKPATTPRISILDPAPAVANHLKNVMLERNMEINTDGPTIELIASGSDVVLKQLYNKFCIGYNTKDQEYKNCV